MHSPLHPLHRAGSIGCLLDHLLIPGHHVIDSPPCIMESLVSLQIAKGLVSWSAPPRIGIIFSALIQNICSERWSMVNACTPQGEPILGTSGEKKNWIMYIVLFLHAMRNLQRVQSSDGGISLPPAMVPNLCIDKKLGFDSPRCAVSFLRIGIGQMDSKQEFFAPIDVQVNLECATLISSAAYTHTL